ncbi:DUF333 domain-containing protein [Candidatus Nomurabacteria bacterium]|nr:DUF333 domain-containing protein [Candidatus Nomurabacteria bacterium]
MKIIKKSFTAVFVLLFFVLGAQGLSAMPNPSSIFCIDNGGTLGDSVDIGLCHFPDGSECETWAYMRGECEPGMYIDWVDEVESKNHILYFWITEQGPKYFETNPPFFSLDSFREDIPSVEKEEANFIFSKITVQSRNRFAHADKSSTSILHIFKDGIDIDSINIPERAYYESFDVYVYIPVPKENTGRYTMSLSTSGEDESFAWHGEDIIDFGGAYWTGQISEDSSMNIQLGESEEKWFWSIISFFKTFFKR